MPKKKSGQEIDRNIYTLYWENMYSAKTLISIVSPAELKKFLTAKVPERRELLNCYRKVTNLLPIQATHRNQGTVLLCRELMSPR